MVLLALSLFAASVHSNPVFKTDERFELTGIVFYLAGCREYSMICVPSYKEAIDEWFCPYKMRMASDSAFVYHVHGVVTDSLSNGIQGAVIAFGNTETGKVFYAASEKEGNYAAELPGGSYSITVTHLSYADYRDSMEIKNDGMLDRIILREAEYRINEAVVEAGYIKRKGSRFIAEVKGNPLAKGRSALSFMNQLPGVRGIDSE